MCTTQPFSFLMAEKFEAFSLGGLTYHLLLYRPLSTGAQQSEALAYLLPSSEEYSRVRHQMSKSNNTAPHTSDFLTWLQYL